MIAEILPYVVSAGGAYAWLRAANLRKSEALKAEIDADNTWRLFYKELVSDMKTEIGELKQEVFMLREIVESYKATCDGCPNNKRKKP